MEKRLPRKRKKHLKMCGGFEYYLQVPRKNIGIATEKDFINVMKDLNDKYDKVMFDIEVLLHKEKIKNK